MAVVGYATIQLIPSLQGFAGSTNRQMAPVVQSVGKQSGEKAGGLFGGSFIGAVGKILTAAGIYEIGSRVASTISTGISAGIKGFADLQTYTISFKTLLGSAQAANDMIRDLYAFAAKTPFDVEGSVVGAQKLLGVGVAAQDVIPTLTTLGDAVGALGGSTGDFNSVLLAYSQIMARGKVSTQDLYQISNTGIPIFQLMSKALGKPVGEIQKLIETGKLASEDVLPQLLDVMNQEYGGAMAGQAETLNGLWSTFKDTMVQTLTTALTPVGEWLVSILPGATTAAVGAIQLIQDKFGEFYSYLTDPNNKIGQTFQPLIDGLTNTDWESLFGSIASALDQAWQIIQPVLEDTNKGLGENLPLAAQAASDVLNGLFTPSVVLTGDAMQDQSQFFDVWMDNTNEIGRTSLNAVFGLASLTGQFLQGKDATELWQGVLDGKFGPALQKLAPGLTTAGAAISAFTSVSSLKISSFVATAIGQFTNFRSRTETTIGLLNSGGQVQFYNAVTTWNATLMAGAARMVLDFGVKIALLPGKVVGVIAQVTSQFVSLGSIGVSSGRALVEGFARGIEAAVERVRSAAKSVVDAAANFFPHSPAPEGPFSGKGWTLFSGRALVEGFQTGIIQRQGALRRTMANTFAAPNIANVAAPRGNISDAMAAVASGQRSGAYIGEVNLSSSNTNAGIIDDLNFLLRSLSRGGR